MTPRRILDVAALTRDRDASSRRRVAGARLLASAHKPAPPAVAAEPIRRRRSGHDSAVAAAGRYRRHGTAARGRVVRRHALGARGVPSQCGISVDESRRRCDVNIQWRRAAATPRLRDVAIPWRCTMASPQLRRGHSVETSCDVNIQWRRAAATPRLRDVAIPWRCTMASPQLRRGHSVETSRGDAT